MEVIERAPTEVWDLFQRKRKELTATYERIAYNSDIGIEIYLSSEWKDGKDDGYFPCITVFMDDNEIYDEVAVDETDCENTVKKIYLEYLSEERLVNRLADEEDGTEDEAQAEIEMSEDFLCGSTLDYIENLTGEPLEKVVGEREAYEIAQDVLDHMCEYLYRKHHVSVRRPMILEDEDGEEFYEEYPYECMEFEESPLYET